MTDKSVLSNFTALYHTLGCKLNFAETSSIADQLHQLGVDRATPGQAPDIIVVNTCSVTETADKKCRQTIRLFHRRYPQAAIVVTGCYAQLCPKEIEGLDGVAIVAGSDKKADIAEFVKTWLQDHRAILAVQASKDIQRFTPSCSRGDRTRFFLKVQDGCDCWCTYCTIPAARGRSRSATVKEIVAQAQQAAIQGAKEIVITGVNIGDFGRRNGTATPSYGLLGKPTGENLLDLLRALETGVPLIKRYRISSIEPDLLTDEIIEYIAGSKVFMPHFHIPLQSGSDIVLRLMHRRYDTRLFQQKILKIKRLIPDAFIGVDIIAGMRGETPEEFESSYDFIQSLPITRLHVFPYSERPGTLALKIPHQVNPEQKRQRVERLIALSDEKFHAFAKKYLGTTRLVLLEHPGKEGVISGYTDNYLRACIPTIPRSDYDRLDNVIMPVSLSKIVTNELGESEFESNLE